jgi:hypothetical protein
MIAATLSHEKIHVDIMHRAWDDFASFANGLEGHWCPCECAYLAKAAISIKEAVEVAFLVANNAQFDLLEYGFDVGGETREQLDARMDDSLKAARAANIQLTEKMAELADCIKNSKR